MSYCLITELRQLRAPTARSLQPGSHGAPAPGCPRRSSARSPPPTTSATSRRRRRRLPTTGCPSPRVASWWYPKCRSPKRGRRTSGAAATAATAATRRWRHRPTKSVIKSPRTRKRKSRSSDPWFSKEQQKTGFKLLIENQDWHSDSKMDDLLMKSFLSKFKVWINLNSEQNFTSGEIADHSADVSLFWNQL